MEEIFDIQFSTRNVVCLSITLCLLVLLPVVFWLVWHCRHRGQLKFKYLLAGVIGFIITARVLELGVHYFCLISNNPVSSFINGNTVAFVLYGAIMAGLFEECGRYIILKYILRRDRTRENAVLYGIGHGGIEVLAVILPATALQLAAAIMFTKGNVPAALSSLRITEEAAAAALPVLREASQFGTEMLALTIVERILAMLIHISLTVTVFFGILEHRKGFLALAIFLHTATDIFPGLFQRGLVSIRLCEVWVAFCTAAIVFIAVRLYRKMKAQPSCISD